MELSREETECSRPLEVPIGTDVSRPGVHLWLILITGGMLTHSLTEAARPSNAPYG